MQTQTDTKTEKKGSLLLHLQPGDNNFTKFNSQVGYLVYLATQTNNYKQVQSKKWDAAMCNGSKIAFDHHVQCYCLEF